MTEETPRKTIAEENVEMRAMLRSMCYHLGSLVEDAAIVHRRRLEALERYPSRSRPCRNE